MLHTEVTIKRAEEAKERHKRFTIPHGLKKLLEDMSREILRNNPDNIPLFLAEYLEGRLVQRKADYLLSGREDGEGYFDNYGERPGSKGGTGTGTDQHFLRQLQDAQEGKPITSQKDEKLIALQEGRRYSGILKQDQDKKRTSTSGDPNADGALNYPNIKGGPNAGGALNNPNIKGGPNAGGALNNPNIKGGPNAGGSKDYTLISSSTEPSENQTNQRRSFEYGGRKGKIGPYGPYDDLAGKHVDVILGTIPEQIDNLVQEVAAAVDITKDMDPEAKGPEFEDLSSYPNKRKRSVHFDSSGNEITKNQIQGSTNTSGSPRGTIKDSVEVLNKAIDLVNTLEDLENVTRPIGQSGNEPNINGGGARNTGSPNTGSPNTRSPNTGFPNTRSPNTGSLNTGSGSRPTSNRRTEGHPYNPADVRPSEAPIYHIANAVSSDLSEFPISLAESTTLLEMIRRAIENLLQRLILAMSGTIDNTETNYAQTGRDLFDNFDESTGASRLFNSNTASTRLNDLNFIPSGASGSGYPNFPPGSDVALAGSSVRRVYESGANYGTTSNYESTSAFAKNPPNGILPGPSGNQPAGVGMNATNSKIIPLKGLAAYMFANNIKQINEMNLGEYVEGMVQRATQLVDLSKQSYDQNPEARKNSYDMVRPSRRVTAVDLLNTTTQILGTIDAAGIDPVTGLPNDSVKDMIKMTTEMLEALRDHIAIGEREGENPLALEALRMGAESLEVALLLLRDTANTKKYGDAGVLKKTSPVSSPTENIENKSKGSKTLKTPDDPAGKPIALFIEADGTILKMSPSGKHLIGPDGKNIILQRTKSGRYITPDGLQINFDSNGKIIPDRNALKLSPSGKHMIGPDGKEIVLQKTKSGRFFTPDGLQVIFDKDGKIVLDSQAMKLSPSAKLMIGPDGKEIILQRTKSGRFLTPDGIQVNFDKDGKIILDSQTMKLSPSGKHLIGPDGKEIILEQTKSGRFVTPDGLPVKFDKDGKIVLDTQALKLSPSGKHLIGPDGKEMVLQRTKSGRFITQDGLHVNIDKDGKILLDSQAMKLSPSGKHLIGPDGKEMVLQRTKSGHFITPNGLQVIFDKDGKIILDTQALKLSPSGKHIIGPGGKEINLQRTKSGRFITPDGLHVNFDKDGKIILESQTMKLSPSGKHMIGPDGKEMALQRTKSGNFITPNGLQVKFDKDGKIVLDTQALKLSPSGKHMIGPDGKEIMLQRTKSGHFITPDGLRVEVDSNGKIILPGADVNSKTSGVEKSKSANETSTNRASPPIPGVTTQSSPNISPIIHANVPTASVFGLGLEGSDGDIDNVLFQQSRMEFTPEMGQWSDAIKDFMNNQVHIIRQLLAGEIPLEEARGQIVFLAVSFVVGVVVGYAVARSVGLFSQDRSSPQFREASLASIPFLNDEELTRILSNLGMHTSSSSE